MFKFIRNFQLELNAKFVVLLIVLKIVLIFIAMSLLGNNEHKSFDFRFSPLFRNSALDTKLLSKIPKMISYNETELFFSAEKVSNLALIYWSQWKDISNVWSDRNLNVCSNVDLPNPDEIRFNNINWQQFVVNSNLTIYLYNAFLDNRQSVSTVKILAMTDNQLEANNTNLWCFLWFENYHRPVMSKVSLVYMIFPWEWGRRPGIHGPLYIVCDIPVTLKNLVPKAVSLTLNDSCASSSGIKLTHNLRVIYNKAAVRQEFAVCCKALRFASVDQSVQLIEWLEMLKILGASKVFLYKLGAHPNMVKVLQYYSKNNFVDWRQITLPDKQMNNDQLYQWYFTHIGMNRLLVLEIIDFHDCLYRNMYNYKYIAVIDTDELIVPITAYNWSQLITQIQGSINNSYLVKSYSYYENTNSHFYVELETDKMVANNNQANSNIPWYMFKMRHVYRKKFTEAGSNVKCFLNTDLVEALYWHYPHKCVGSNGLYGTCSGHRISTNHSFLFHYKREYKKPEVCNSTDIKQCAIYDTTLWKYYDQLNDNMNVVLKNIFT